MCVLLVTSACARGGRIGQSVLVSRSEPGYFDLREWGGKHGPSTRWNWRLITSDGNTIAQSVGSFGSRTAAEDSIKWTRTNARDCPARLTPWRWDLTTSDGKAVVTSVQFAESPNDVEDTLAWVRTHAAACAVRTGHPHERRLDDQGPAGRTIWNDEALFVAFVMKADPTPEVYRRWRLLGIPISWLIHAGFPPGPLYFPRDRKLP
jgi:uncharacterized protein YegP (UPF0339 family)